ncbi:RidA family protein [Scytonema sp. NUACC21]
MTRRITHVMQSVISKLSRRHTLVWLGGSGLTTAVAIASQNQEVTATANKDDLKLLNPPGLYDATKNGYSHIAVAPSRAKTVYISGQFGSDENGNLISDDFAAQMKQAFVNLRIALAAVGAEPEHVAKTTVLIVNHSEDKLPLLGAEIQAMWGTKPPANTLIPVPRLALDGMLFEIDATAVIPET